MDISSQDDASKARTRKKRARPAALTPCTRGGDPWMRVRTLAAPSPYSPGTPASLLSRARTALLYYYYSSPTAPPHSKEDSFEIREVSEGHGSRRAPPHRLRKPGGEADRCRRWHVQEYRELSSNIRKGVSIGGGGGVNARSRDKPGEGRRLFVVECGVAGAGEIGRAHV